MSVGLEIFLLSSFQQGFISCAINFNAFSSLTSELSSAFLGSPFDLWQLERQVAEKQHSLARSEADGLVWESWFHSDTYFHISHQKSKVRNIRDLPISWYCINTKAILCFWHQEILNLRKYLTYINPFSWLGRIRQSAWVDTGQVLQWPWAKCLRQPLDLIYIYIS